MLGTSPSPSIATKAVASLNVEGSRVAPFGPHLSTADPSSTAPSEYTEVVLSSLRSLYNTMTGTAEPVNVTCLSDCSGRGECLNGTCFCLVQYEGETCRDPNVAYFASFSCIFFFIAAISLAQLIVCVRAEYQRLKTPTLRKACAVTTQKMLYIITFVASAIRGAYFSSPSNAELTLASSFLSSFYPVILSGGSLIVCFWAEAFHLRDIRCERPRFLGKSFLGFVTFNAITYSLFAAEVILQKETQEEEDRRFLTHVFNGCYAVLMFIMVVFFLIYGVEVYFKVRGGFVCDTLVVGTLQSRRASPHNTTSTAVNTSTTTTHDTTQDDVEGKTPLRGACSAHVRRHHENDSDESDECCCGDDDDDRQDTLSYVSKSTSTTTITSAGSSCSASSSSTVVTADRTSPSTAAEPLLEDAAAAALRQPECEQATHTQTRLLHRQPIRVGSPGARGIDYSQLSQSRFGLVFQACMLMITVCFLCSDVLGGFWKNRVPLISRNAYDIVFRVVELGVALWFPCVLWNCIAPEQLWILNPKKILKKIDIDKSVQVSSEGPDKEAPSEESTSRSASVSSLRECWICYDTSENTDAGPMIEPCLCRGDVAAVHHNCLRQWLMESAQSNNTDQLACKVCQADYELERSPSFWIGQGFTSRHWLHTASLVTVMCGTIAGAWTVLQMYQDALVRSMTAGVLLLIIYICLRFLGFNTFTAYQRARYSAVKILNRHFSSDAGGSRSTGSTPGSPSRGSVSSASTDTDTYVSTITDGQVSLDIPTVVPTV